MKFQNRGKAKTKSTTVIPLSDVITALKEDLAVTARKRSPEFEGMFEIQDLTVELAVRFVRTNEFGGSLGLVAKVTEHAESAHKLIVKMSPIDPRDLIKRKNAANPLIQGSGQKRVK